MVTSIPDTTALQLLIKQQEEHIKKQREKISSLKHNGKTLLSALEMLQSSYPAARKALKHILDNVSMDIASL